MGFHRPSSRGGRVSPTFSIPTALGSWDPSVHSSLWQKEIRCLWHEFFREIFSFLLTLSQAYIKCRFVRITPHNHQKATKHQNMKKISILDQFAADAINAPAVITGGGNCGDKGGSKAHKTGSKGPKCGTKSHKSGSKGGSKSHKSGSKPSCVCDPKLCWN
jgi:hypothetical protein